MNLTATTLLSYYDMIINGGRTSHGRWRSVNHDITCGCKDGKHDQCGGWIFPTGGPRECFCLCHDDGNRPDYRDTLAATVKATNWWRVNDFVTIDGTDAPWWKVTFVDNRANQVHATGPDGQLAIAGFDLLNLFRR